MASWRVVALFAVLNVALWCVFVLFTSNGTLSWTVPGVQQQQQCPQCAQAACPACPASATPAPVVAQKKQWDTGIPGLDGLYVFSLARQPERRARLAALMAALGMKNIEWVEPYDSKVLQRRWEANDFTWNSSETKLDLRKQGQINIDRPTVSDKSKVPVDNMWKITAQWQSFVRTWRRFKASGQRTAAFFEDDIDFTRTFSQDLARLLRTSPAPWSMMRIGGCYEDPTQLLVPPDLYRSTGQWCMDGYVLHADGVHTLLECMDYESMDWPNPDSHVHNYCPSQSGWKSYSVIPRLSGQLNKEDVGVHTRNSTSEYLVKLLSAKIIKK